MVGIIFHVALPVFDRHLDFVGNLFIRVVDLTLHAHNVACLVAGRPEDDIRSLIYECEQPLNQVVDEPVLVQIEAFLAGNIQNSGRLDLSIFIRGDKLCILA